MSSASIVNPLLELRHVTRRFGGLVAVNDLTMSVMGGTIHGLIGPNGAGKSTAFDLISGLVSVSGGEVILGGRTISGMPAEARVAAGICRTFQTPRLFERMSVLDTVRTGRHLHGSVGVFGSMFSLVRKRREEREIAATAAQFLDIVGLSEEAEAPVGDLSYGKRRLVEIARALATEPKLLLLDEVTSGLNPIETAAVGNLIEQLARGGLTIVLVEHDMKFVMRLCERITVLNFGSRIAEGTPDEVARDEAVIAAYLGRREEGRTPRRDLRGSARGRPADQRRTTRGDMHGKGAAG
jgi:branched-chain amino acid transport system ATP-binding protein